MIFKLLKCAALGGECQGAQALERGAWEAIYSLSKEHDLAHMVGYAAKNLGLNLDEDLQKSFEKAMNVAAFRYAKSSYELESLSYTLNEAEICFMPLKGSVLNAYYPEPWLRTSCDIDVLVKREDLEKAKEVLTNELGYKFEYGTTHDASMVSPSGVHVELHFDLNEEEFKESELLTNVWQESELEKANDYEYKMTNELFVFYHIYHMAKHVKVGGCGIKPLVDLIVIKNKMGYDEEKVLKMLANDGLADFYRATLDLADAWFEGKEYTPLTKSMQEYILSGGAYGTFEHNVAVAQAKQGKLARLLRRIFMPYNKLIIRYPSLKKCPPLYPIYLVIRWLRIIFKGDGKRALNEIKANQKISQNEINDVKSLMQNLGI